MDVGGIPIGNGSPVVVQSMTDTDTSDVQSTVSQIKDLVDAGCELVRVTVNNDKSARSIEEIKSRLNFS